MEVICTVACKNKNTQLWSIEKFDVKVPYHSFIDVDLELTWRGYFSDYSKHVILEQTVLWTLDEEKESS